MYRMGLVYLWISQQHFFCPRLLSNILISLLLNMHQVQILRYLQTLTQALAISRG